MSFCLQKNECKNGNLTFWKELQPLKSMLYMGFLIICCSALMTAWSEVNSTRSWQDWDNEWGPTIHVNCKLEAGICDSKQILRLTWAAHSDKRTPWSHTGEKPRAWSLQISQDTKAWEQGLMLRRTEPQAPALCSPARMSEQGWCRDNVPWADYSPSSTSPVT